MVTKLKPKAGTARRVAIVVVELACPFCKEQICSSVDGSYQFTEEDAGKMVECPGCFSQIRIPKKAFSSNHY